MLLRLLRLQGLKVSQKGNKGVGASLWGLECELLRLLRGLRLVQALGLRHVEEGSHCVVCPNTPPLSCQIPRVSLAGTPSL